MSKDETLGGAADDAVVRFERWIDEKFPPNVVAGPGAGPLVALERHYRSLVKRFRETEGIAP